MLVHPHPDPVAFQVFGLSIHWYGLMYLAGFIIAWIVGRRLVRYNSFAALRGIYLEDFVTAAALGVVIGGRLGYVFFYNPAYYLQHPQEIIYLWEGGMSFHGGLLGVIIALYLLAKIHAVPLWAHEKNADPALQFVTSTKHTFLRLFDFAAVLTPPGLGLGRLANFINAELPGRVTSADLPWAMVFGYPDNLPRHPSQLYQLFLEGVVLTVLMMWLVRRPHPPGWLAGIFICAYAVVRFLTEFFREPDGHLGFIVFNLSMGQLLSLPMLLLGLIMMYRLQLAQVWHGDARGLSLKQTLHDFLYADAEAYESRRRQVHEHKSRQTTATKDDASKTVADVTVADVTDVEDERAQRSGVGKFLHNLLFEEKEGKEEDGTLAEQEQYEELDDKGDIVDKADKPRRKRGNFLHNLLFEDTGEEQHWERHEKDVAENYGDDDGDNEEGDRNVGQFIKSLLFGASAEEESDDTFPGGLTRRQKRRLKKKKRKN